MKLVPAGKAVEQESIERRAECEEQRDQRQRGEEKGRHAQLPMSGAGLLAACTDNDLGEGNADRERGQQPGTGAQIVAALDVVLDAPEDGIIGLSQPVYGCRLPAESPEVEPVVMAGIAEDVGQEECKDVAVRPGPSDDLLVGCGAFAEVLLHQLIQRQELDCSGGKAKKWYQENPSRDSGQRLQNVTIGASAARLVRGRHRRCVVAGGAA